MFAEIKDLEEKLSHCYEMWVTRTIQLGNSPAAGGKPGI